MTKKQLIELEFSRKTYETIPTEEMSKKVTELENVLQQKLEIWGDEDTYNKFQKLNTLNLSDRRLMLVYSLLDGSIPKTATFFSVNRKTIMTNILRIKTDLGLI